jgi:hypothetical protein
MKKNILLLFVLLTLTVSACSGQASAASSDPAQQPAPAVESVAQDPIAAAPATAQEAATGRTELNTSYENAASVELQLLVGTLKLIGTDQAVTKDQATALAPLWTNLQTLHQSMRPDPAQNDSNSQPQTDNTALQSQVNEIVKQIQSLMTPAQLQAIAALQITRESAMTFMQDLGMTMGGPGGDGQGGAGAPPGGGQPPSSGQPGGDQMATPPAGRNGSGSGMVPPQLIDTLVQVLQKIASGETITTIPTISANPPVTP